MLRAESVSCSLGGKPVLKDLSAKFREKKITAIIGPSGGGKSTLLKILGRTLEPSSGRVVYPTNSTTSLSFQEGALFDSLSVLDNVAFPLVQGRVPVATLASPEREEVLEKAIDILVRVGLRTAVRKLPGQLSGGMKRRVSLARALVNSPDILLLDDPTSGLDPVASSVIMELIVAIHHEYAPTTIIVSHDLRRLIPVVDDIVAIDQGAVSFSGERQSFRSMASPALQHFVSCRYDWA